MNELCNFDSSDAIPDKSSSGCIEICVSYSRCRQELLGDGKCDAGMNNLECNMNICGWDWGDCGYCASGCSKDTIENSQTCKKECNNHDCNLHDGVCVRSI